MKPCDELEIVGLDATYRKYYLKGYEDAEKEHNYHLKKIKAEIDKQAWAIAISDTDRANGMWDAYRIIDKYKGDKE